MNSKILPNLQRKNLDINSVEVPIFLFKLQNA